MYSLGWEWLLGDLKVGVGGGGVRLCIRWGGESYLSTVRVGVPSVWLFNRSIV